MSKAFDKVMDGLADADSYLNGERDGFKVHAIEVPEPDVVAIRSKTGLSQPAFAKSIEGRRRRGVRRGPGTGGMSTTHASGYIG